MVGRAGAAHSAVAGKAQSGSSGPSHAQNLSSAVGFFSRECPPTALPAGRALIMRLFLGHACRASPELCDTRAFPVQRNVSQGKCLRQASGFWTEKCGKKPSAVRASNGRFRE